MRSHRLGLIVVSLRKLEPSSQIILSQGLNVLEMLDAVVSCNLSRTT